MSCTYDSFVRDYPEFAGLPRPAVERRLDLAARLHKRSAWGLWVDTARELWTAHALALDHDVAGPCVALGLRDPYETGSVSARSASTGSVAVSTSVNALQTGNDPVLVGLSRTGYGLEYLALLYAVVPPGAVVYSPDTSASGGR